MGMDVLDQQLVGQRERPPVVAQHRALPRVEPQEQVLVDIVLLQSFQLVPTTVRSIQGPMVVWPMEQTVTSLQAQLAVQVLLRL